ncbi:MAG: delta-60 repeat domain-containing protein [Bacteroidales bacterium]|nr:delta-60 repeat domain-containing protein [Bacteroidales bacterium]
MKKISLSLFALTAFSFVALAQPGSLDPTFNPGLGTDYSVFTTALQADGKILIAGMFDAYNGTPRNKIARLNKDGSLDTGFNPRILGELGYVSQIALQADGKILIVGMFLNFKGPTRGNVTRLNANGRRDRRFKPGDGAMVSASALALQADGKIIIVGEFTEYNGISRNRVARINANGSLDTGFDPGTGANNTVLSIALQVDGKIIIAGNFTSYNGTTRNRIARLNADGSLDNGFDPLAGANELVFTTALQADGKIIIGGSFTSYNGTPINHIARIIGE